MAGDWEEWLRESVSARWFLNEALTFGRSRLKGRNLVPLLGPPTSITAFVDGNRPPPWRLTVGIWRPPVAIVEDMRSREFEGKIELHSKVLRYAPIDSNLRIGYWA